MKHLAFYSNNCPLFFGTTSEKGYLLFDADQIGSTPKSPLKCDCKNTLGTFEELCPENYFDGSYGWSEGAPITLNCVCGKSAVICFGSYGG